MSARFVTTAYWSARTATVSAWSCFRDHYPPQRHQSTRHGHALPSESSSGWSGAVVGVSSVKPAPLLLNGTITAELSLYQRHDESASANCAANARLEGTQSAMRSGTVLPLAHWARLNLPCKWEGQKRII